MRHTKVWRQAQNLLDAQKMGWHRPGMRHTRRNGMSHLKQMLYDQSITQRRVAVALRLSETTVSRILNGHQEMTASQISGIAALLGCDANTVLGMRSASSEDREP